jgi:YD repeat-containing protein
MRQVPTYTRIYSYDGASRLASLGHDFADSARDVTIELSHNPAGQIATRRVSKDAFVFASPPQGTINSTADGLNRIDSLKSASQASEDMSFDYDETGNLVGQTNPAGRVDAIYDLAGRRTEIKWPLDGYRALYEHLVTGEVSVIRDKANPAAAEVVLATYGYDDLGRRTSIARGNGVSTQYGYRTAPAPGGRGTPWLTRIAHDVGGASATHDLTLDFTRNPAGQIHSRTASNETYSFAGHAAGDLRERQRAQPARELGFGVPAI